MHVNQISPDWPVCRSRQCPLDAGTPLLIRWLNRTPAGIESKEMVHAPRHVHHTAVDCEMPVHYNVHGPLFFGSSNDLVERFSYGADPKRVLIDLTHSQIWDASSVAALDSIETKYREHGATVSFTGLDQRSSSFHQRLTGQLGA
jgi:SulP family sulfate permease